MIDRPFSPRGVFRDCWCRVEPYRQSCPENDRWVLKLLVGAKVSRKHPPCDAIALCQRSRGSKTAVLWKGSFGECALIPVLGAQEYQKSWLSSVRAALHGKMDDISVQGNNCQNHRKLDTTLWQTPEKRVHAKGSYSAKGRVSAF